MGVLRVCASDVYIRGEASQIELGGVILFGEFNFSINNNAHRFGWVIVVRS